VALPRRFLVICHRLDPLVNGSIITTVLRLRALDASWRRSARNQGRSPPIEELTDTRRRDGRGPA